MKESHSFIYFQWNLVCGRDHLWQTTQSIFTVGSLIGSVVFALLADKYGRKPVHLLSQYVLIAVGVGCAFSSNLTIFAVFRFIMGGLREVSMKYIDQI